MFTIGTDILDIGTHESERARRRMSPHATSSDVFGFPGKFELPYVADPALFCRNNFASASGSKDAGQVVKFAKGTTTLAFKFNEGIIVSVDSRSTMGAYIASGTVKKVIEINPFLLGTMAGGAADCSFWERNLGMQCRLYELRNKKRITVAAASKLLANTMNSYRGYGLSMGTMITGWDETGPQLYYVDNDGTRLHGKLFAVGSGSTYAYGVLDTFYRPDLTVDEAIDLGKRAIYHATHRDAYSGGINNLYHVTKDGWRKVHSIDVNDMHYEFLEEKQNDQFPPDRDRVNMLHENEYPKVVPFDDQLPSIQELVKKAKILLEQTFLSSNDSTTGRTSSNDQDCPFFCTVAPGRVNLIGEHVDYTGGLVLPFAIEYSTVVYGYVHCTTNNHNRLRVVSDVNPADVLLVENFTVNDVRDQWLPSSLAARKWTNYIIGIVKEYLPHLLLLNQSDIGPAGPTTTVDIAFAITSNVPLGSGLSSSASLLVSVATFMEHALVLQNDTLLDSVYHNDTITPLTRHDSYEIPRALKCQQVEFNFCSTPCGIMDQFVSSAAQLHTLLLIDCEQQTYTAVQPPSQYELDSNGICFVVCNSHVKHDNANGEYPIRVQECHEALMKIQAKVLELSQSTTNPATTIPKSLRHVTLQHLSLFDTDEEFLSSTLYKRVRHVVTENQRVLECATAFRTADWETVGKLMAQSHESMKHDYEVSCEEIDCLVEWANTYTTTSPGRVYGSRLTGGGFGGCTVTLCDAQIASALIQDLQTKFFHAYGIHCTCFITKPQDGARRVLLPNRI